jgi:hypothetical protein
MTERPAALPRPLWWALAGGLLLSTWLIFGFDPLPISDLPQHAAQVALLPGNTSSTFSRPICWPT